jgi:multidrug efflux pump subunit AcrB/outer membrane protein TolC
VNPVKAALRNRQVVFVLTAFAVLLGLRALGTMPRREDPKITIRTGLVLARYPGATAQQVEEQVTRRIEERLFRHAEVRKGKTFSTSRDGAVVVNVELEESVKDPDRFWAMLRHDLNELKAIELPPTVQGPIVNANFGDVVAVLLAVRGTGAGQYTPAELRDYLDRIEDRIRTIREVSRINRHGEQREELRVTTSNARLAGFGITPMQVAGAIRGRNAVQDAGAVDAGAGALVPIRTTGLLTTPDALSRLLVATSRDGRPVYLGDFASVERRVEDPSYLVRVDGEDAALLSVEMQEGHNIVQFGKEVRAKVAEVQKTLPAGLTIEAIADQPAAVETRMIHFGREFLITLAAVILVTVALLPLRIAAIAAVAIPITVAITVTILSMVGIELHQVTFAGLVVALGIVVDDAIVVADNYVEKLDHGMSPLEAAWRAPTELAIPVLAATLTIVASFLPLAFLPGAPGEFIRAMSYTVAIALMVSFAVAMLLTPILAVMLAKTGLHPAGGETSHGTSLIARLRDARPLDAMQSAYERMMALAMPRKRWTLVGAALAFVAGLGLMATVPYRFFPLNEREQFIIDVWMPAGTRVEGTDAVMRRLEPVLRAADGVEDVATFVGGGAPRFYYNLNPEPPTPNYGEFLVNTVSAEATQELVRHLQAKLDAAAPEAWVYVKPLTQGPVFAAPVEVRLVSDDAAALRAWGDTVVRIFERTPGSAYVHTDWRDDELALAIRPRDEAVARLGFTDADIATQIAAGFDGVPVSTFWEGTRDLDITLRLDEAERSGLDDVASAYLIAPATGARVPLRQIADVGPEWRTSRIVRRNGVRTLTVRSFSKPDVLPSVVLKAAQPQLAALHLPDGMRLEYGGELEGSAEVQGAVNIALFVSLMGVFLILLFQFRTVRHPLVVMVSIPLAVVGAAVGLVLTHNPFTYTANLGLNALTGVVVRNAIILVDYAIELRASGVDLETAALLAGRRRLRPIFLTTMAAALGVTPMILSGSPLWSPMASVLAVGLVVSMVFTLVVVPVLYVVVERRRERKAAAAQARPASAASAPLAAAAAMALLVFAPLAIAGSSLGAQAAADAAPPAMRLTLDDAIARAREHGTMARLARAKVDGAVAREQGARSDYLPRLATTVNRLQSNSRTRIVIPQGMLGNDGGGAPIPSADRRFDQGAAAVTLAQVTVTQPVTQLYRIKQAAGFASAGVRAANAGQTRAELDAELAVRRLYYGALIARAKVHAAEATVAAKRQSATDAERAVAAGAIVRTASLAATASVAEAEYTLVTAENEAADIDANLADAIGVHPSTPLELVAPAASGEPLRTVADYVADARESSADVQSAQAALDEARHGVALARSDFIPDLGVGVTYTYQSGVAFLPTHAASFAIQGSWTVLDFGKRTSVVRERKAGVEAATIALEHARNAATIAVETAYRHAARAEKAAVAARAAFEARSAALRIARDQEHQGLTLASLRSGSEAELAASEATVIAAELESRIARAELERAVRRK